jgi:hypothetical protein
MSLRSLLAKDWVVEVGTSASSTPAWPPIRGLTSFEEEIKTKTEDDSDFDGDGWSSDAVTQRPWTLKCKRDNSSATFVPDPGQDFVRRAGRERTWSHHAAATAGQSTKHSRACPMSAAATCPWGLHLLGRHPQVEVYPGDLHSLRYESAPLEGPVA